MEVSLRTFETLFKLTMLSLIAQGGFVGDEGGEIVL